jgi:hypothetical protein
MKTFNVALLSDDNACKSSFFARVNAHSEEEAIQLAQGALKAEMIDLGCDPEYVEEEVMEYFPEIFELKEI